MEIIKKSELSENIGPIAIKPVVESKVIEVDFSLEKIEEKSDLVRLEMNAIEFPLFTKNKKIGINVIMKYIFNRGQNRFIEVSPKLNSKIPGELEEKIFLALMKIYRNNNYNPTIYADYFTLCKEMGVVYSTKTVRSLKEGITKLNGTIYTFNNCFYSNNERKIINDKIETNLFNVRTIEFKEAQNLAEGWYLKFFRNSKIKEILEIRFSGHFLDNVIKKGFLRFDSKLLLEMNDIIARDLYKMMTKWRQKQLYLKLYSRVLVSRIPLSFTTPQQINFAVKRIEAALTYLKEKELIDKFIFTKTDKKSDSFFEVFFSSKHNFDYFKDIGDEVFQSHIDYSIEAVEENQKTEEISFNEKIEDYIAKARRSVYISNFEKEYFKKIINKQLQEYGENIVLKILEKLYKYNNEINDLEAFVIHLAKSVVKDNFNNIEREEKQLSFDFKPKKEIDIEKEYAELTDEKRKEYECRYDKMLSIIKETNDRETLIKAMLREDLESQ